DQRQLLPVADEIEPEPAAGVSDSSVRRQLDEVGRLLLVQVISPDEAELHGCRRDALLEVERVETEVVAQELDDVFVSGRVARLRHEQRIASAPAGSRRGSLLVVGTGDEG